MLCIKTASKLKLAGLRWEPQMGDFMYNNDIIDCLDFADMSFAAGYEDLTHQGDVGFIPRLDQLLAEIEKRGWKWSIVPSRNRYRLILTTVKQFVADSPEEAAALALLWILEQVAIA